MSGYSGRNRPAENGGPQGVQRSYASQLKEEGLFNSYEHLAGLPRGDAAFTMLRRVASLVKPIMRKRGWKVQVLAEFLPPEQNLLGLNINRGYKICIRLRYHHNPDLFLPLEQVVDTMLHELSHNVWGDHDSNFHRLWDELRDEWETLTRKGYTGEGFLSKGQKLGGGHVPPPHEMRRLARASAEKRQAQSKLTKGSGKRLGGTPIHLMGGDIRNTIADQVTRRNTIDKGCGSGWKNAVKISDDNSNNTFKTKADEDDANDRAIAQALYELMEEEEERKLQGTFSEVPLNGGLAWHPENGLYDPKSERPPDSNGDRQKHPSEEEQIKWALQASSRSTPDIPDKLKPLPGLPADIARTVSAPPDVIESRLPTPLNPHPNPLKSNPPSPVGDKPPATKRKRPVPQGSSSNSDPPSNEIASPIPIRPINLTTEPQGLPVLDISDPFDPAAAPPEQWNCELCTCVNPLQFLACDACGTERPQQIGLGNRGARPKPVSIVSAPAPIQVQNQSLGWTCTRCGAFMEHKWWTCSACGQMKESS